MCPKNFKSFHVIFAEKRRLKCKKITCLATKGRGLLPRNLETHTFKTMGRRDIKSPANSLRADFFSKFFDRSIDSHAYVPQQRRKLSYTIC